MKIFNFIKNKFASKEEPQTKNKFQNDEDWPFSPPIPPSHTPEIDAQLNHYVAFGIYSMLSVNNSDLAIADEINHIAIALMENGYGERYANVLLDGILVTNKDYLSALKKSPIWIREIEPWLFNETDFFPRQNGLNLFEQSETVRAFAKRLRDRKQES